MPDGTATNLNSILAALSINQEPIKVDWDKYKVLAGVKHGKNSRTHFKNAIESTGLYIFTKKDKVMDKEEFEKQEQERKEAEVKKKEEREKKAAVKAQDSSDNAPATKKRKRDTEGKA